MERLSTDKTPDFPSKGEMGAKIRYTHSQQPSSRLVEIPESDLSAENALPLVYHLEVSFGLIFKKNLNQGEGEL